MFCGTAEISPTHTSSQQFSCSIKKQIKVLHKAVTVSLTLWLKVEVVEAFRNFLKGRRLIKGERKTKLFGKSKKGMCILLLFYLKCN